MMKPEASCAKTSLHLQESRQSVQKSWIFTLWCFAPRVGFADLSAAQTGLLRNLVCYADLSASLTSVVRYLSDYLSTPKVFEEGLVFMMTPGGVISAADYVDDLIASRLFNK